MTDPITPEEIRTRPDTTEDAVQLMIDFINQILAHDSSVALLLNGKQVTVFDSSMSSYWMAGHEGAVKRFQEVGWLVAHETSVKYGKVYFFQLPLLGFPSQVQVGGSNNTQVIK
jgi:hypothetical protein